MTQVSRAHPRAGRIDAVLPVTGGDMPRARLLLRSLSPRLGCLGTLHVVAPDRQLAEVRAACAGFQLPIEVWPETQVVPELAWLGHLKGWFKQQLIKLAIAEHVGTPFYLTLDADVLCTRPVTHDALLSVDAQGQARAPVSLLPDTHPDWYRQAVAVLGLAPARTGVLHSVTPALLARDGVMELSRFIDQKIARRDFARGLRGIEQRLAMVAWRGLGRGRFARWRLFLGASTPWTEYALYYTFLEATGAFDRYHVARAACIYDVGESVWRADRDRFPTWDPAPLFSGEGPPFFVVVQSITRIPPVEVERKFAPFLE